MPVYELSIVEGGVRAMSYHLIYHTGREQWLYGTCAGDLSWANLDAEGTRFPSDFALTLLSESMINEDTAYANLIMGMNQFFNKTSIDREQVVVVPVVNGEPYFMNAEKLLSL